MVDLLETCEPWLFPPQLESPSVVVPLLATLERSIDPGVSRLIDLDLQIAKLEDLLYEQEEKILKHQRNVHHLSRDLKKINRSYALLRTLREPLAAIINAIHEERRILKQKIVRMKRPVSDTHAEIHDTVDCLRHLDIELDDELGPQDA